MVQVNHLVLQDHKLENPNKGLPCSQKKTQLRSNYYIILCNAGTADLPHVCFSVKSRMSLRQRRVWRALFVSPMATDSRTTPNQ